MPLLDLVDYLFLAQFATPIALYVSLKLFHLLEKRIETVFFRTANKYKNALLDELSTNPEIIAKIINPALKSLAKQYGVPEPGKGGTLNLFGLKIPSAIVEAVLPRIIGRGVDEVAQSGYAG